MPPQNFSNHTAADPQVPMANPHHVAPALGTGAGVVGGVIAGAAIGTAVGPIGAAVGAALGALAGGLAGNAVAESIIPPLDAGEATPALPPVVMVEQETIAVKAYHLWEQRGRYDGRALDDWLQAERDLLSSAGPV